MSRRLIKWLIFSVMIALLPIIFNAIKMITRNNPIELEILFSNGELLIISVAIASAAVGELLGSGEDKIIVKYFAGGGCITIIALASLWFADISTSMRLGENLNKYFISAGSIVMFFLTLISAGSCKALAED